VAVVRIFVMRKLVCALGIAAALVACDRPPVSRDGLTPLTTVSSVDLNRYVGTWYEVARFDHEFERGCASVTATYSLNADGKINVVNRCRRGSPTGPVDDARGTARVVDTATNAKLGVTFFWPFEGDYWILELDPSYEWAVVGEPSGRYLWILSRSPQISDTLRADLLTRIQAKGYNTTKLIWTVQAHEAPGL
jgi:apolipoprotein D and lipocalin family protein